MSHRPEEDNYSRSRNARQVISGADVRPPSPQSNVYAAADGLFSDSQRYYLMVLGGLLIVGVLLWLIFSMGVASIFFFLLALALIFGWLVF
jgi:Flp pilus assembly protein TadB